MPADPDPLRHARIDAANAVGNLSAQAKRVAEAHKTYTNEKAILDSMRDRAKMLLTTEDIRKLTGGR